MSGSVEHKVSRLTDLDLYLFNEGTHAALADKLGAHLGEVDGKPGAFFAVWAPSAKKVHVMGDFNEWSKTKHALKPRGSSGIWEGFVPGVGQGALYKYWIANPSGHKQEKADPVGFRHEEPPRTASVVSSARSLPPSLSSLTCAFCACARMVPRLRETAHRDS